MLLLAPLLTGLSGIWGKIAALGGIIIALALIAFKLISMGKTQERAAEQARVAQSVAQRKAKENEVDALSPTDLDRRLSAQWVRPDGSDK